MFTQRITLNIFILFFSKIFVIDLFIVSGYLSGPWSHTVYFDGSQTSILRPDLLSSAPVNASDIHP